MFTVNFLTILLFSTLAHAGELDGTWRKDCVRGVTRTEVIREDYATLSEDYASDSLCQNPSLRIVSEGEIILPRAGEIDFTFARVSVVPLSERILASYNARAVCGFSDWAMGVAKDVTGLKCAFFGAGLTARMPEAGRQVFGIWRLQGGELYFGKLSRDFDGTTPERRPRDLDPIPYLRLF